MLAAEHLEKALKAGRAHDEVVEYDSSWRDSEIGRDLKPVRNVKPLLSKYGLYLGVLLGGFDMWTNELLGFSVFGTLPHGKPDYASLKPLEAVTPRTYPKLSVKIAFDKLSSVFVSNTNHEEDQPCHLKLKDPTVPIRENLPRYGEPARLYCPAGVYEVVYADEAAKTGPRFVINAQNCVHCKTCDIKDPAQNITWVPAGRRRRTELSEYVKPNSLSRGAREGGKTAHKALLFGMYLRRGYRGRGVGDALMSRLIEEARGSVEIVTLTVMSDNAPAVALYQRWGFESYGTEPRAVKEDGLYFDEMLMSLRLVGR